MYSLLGVAVWHLEELDSVKGIKMSHNWNHRQQRQEQVVEEQEENGYPHVHNQQTQNHLVPMSKCEVAELAWENGQLAMHRLGNNLPNEQTKHTWERASDTLESVVHQATNGQKQNLDLKGSGKNKANINTENIVKQQTIGVAKKRTRSDSDPQLYGTSGRLVGEFQKNIFYQNAEPSGSASAKDTVMTWPNYSLDESSRSFKSKATFNEDSACHAGLENKEEERETKAYNSLRRSRTAAVHNQSERRRRDRINEKMKALQKLVPNASKTDKASMLDEVIKYLKQLQAQIQLISNVRNMESRIMMPPLSLGLMQPHIQMPLLARMGMGVNLGMTTGMLNNMTANLARAAAATTPHQFFTAPFIYPTSVATSCPPFMSRAFAMAPTNPTPPQANGDASASRAAVAPSATHSFPFNDPRSAFLAQSMNMESNNQLAAQYMQQTNNQSMQTRSKNLNQGSLNQRQTE